jgi:hypothetical protein
VPRDLAPTDPRALRFEQAIVTLALLAGFVFRVPWVIVVVAVLLVAALAAGERGNLFTNLYNALFRGPRVLHTGETAAITRLTRAVEAGLLVVASVLVVIGADGFAWVFALPVAAITGLAATTCINVVALARER